MRSSMTWMVLGLSATAWADDLSADTVAAVQHEQKAADDKLSEAHGNKKPSEMSQEERSQFIQEQNKAHQAVLDKHGVDDKTYSRYQARQSKDDREQTKGAEERIVAKEKDDAAKKAAAKKDVKKEPVVQRGFNDRNPVQLEGKEGEGGVVVEKGLPEGEAGANDTGGAGSSAPAKSSHSKRHHQKNDE